MLQIRRRQMGALGEHMRKQFEDFMVDHLRQFFPARCEALGEDGVRGEIRYGIERAAVYEVEARRDVCKYIDVMFALGRDFDEDPALPWAREILVDEMVIYPDERMDRLCAAALAHEGRGGRSDDR